VNKTIIACLLMLLTAMTLTSCKTMSPSEYEAMQQKAKQADVLAERLNKLTIAYDAMEQDLKSEIADQRIQIEKLSDHEVKMTMQQDVLFASTSIIINQKGRGMLAKIAKSLKRAPDAEIKIVGHTDLLPITNSKLKKRFLDNWELSAARAASVARVMIWGEQIVDSRIHVVGRSFVEPVADNRTPEGREKNRRIEIFLIQ